MSTHQTQSGLGRSVEEDRGGLMRLVLKLDAVATGAVGLLSVAAGPMLDDLLGIPLALLVPVGLFLVAYAVAIWIVATRRRVSRPAVWAAVAINLIYVVDCLVVVAASWLPLTPLGAAFVLFQAAAVTLFAAAQFYALRKAARPS
jgi:CHASE2 domain-containing sensor protein